MRKKRRQKRKKMSERIKCWRCECQTSRNKDLFSWQLDTGYGLWECGICSGFIKIPHVCKQDN